VVTTVGGFALNPIAVAAFPEITTVIAHLRDVLGDQTDESLARKGETMTTAAMATYAYDQIDQARADEQNCQQLPRQNSIEFAESGQLE
jgi:hypothetical protein